MLTKINTLTDVYQFAEILAKEEEVNFHPDDDFHEYINTETGEPTYNFLEAELRNQLMGQAFEVCEREGVDIYAYTMKPYLEATGLDKVIPVPE